VHLSCEMRDNVSDRAKHLSFKAKIETAASVKYRLSRGPILRILSDLRRGRPVAPIPVNNKG
jgi:hypothetical protein